MNNKVIFNKTQRKEKNTYLGQAGPVIIAQHYQIPV